ncbi:MAG: DUF3488 domain-containing protein [Acidobacteria bacterium]|nr:DUF3488 domain-containing protein [Acidobacteriota bacterium]
MVNGIERVDRYFLAVSYMVAVCSFAALFSSGAIGIIVACAAVVIVVIAWNIEGTRWQLTERAGLVVIAVLILVFLTELRLDILGFRSVSVIPIGTLGWMILFLCLIKLLQRKTERDWIFIYIISFFEILLAAGLSISPIFLIYFIGFLIFGTCAILSLDISKTAAEVDASRDFLNELSSKPAGSKIKGISVRKFSLIGVVLIAFISVLALPLFYIFPRNSIGGFGSPRFGGNPLSGFSDSVRLGEIGTLKQSDEMVMRVKLEGGELPPSGIYWRGVTLDQFDNKRWRRSDFGSNEKIVRSSNNRFSLSPKVSDGKLFTQRIYLEPIGSPTIFALANPLAVSGNLHSIRQRSDGSIRSDKVGFERITYSVISDPATPPVESLKEDQGTYGEESRRYLQIPEDLDPRISKLALQIAETAPSGNIYDRAKTIEKYLRSEYGYSLNMRSTGPQPVSDFLFNVRQGHCEYFASAMVIMLRTQGIASRIVNGFQQGDYNESADMFVVRQRNAHSWVEVYFPETKSWITFDPTPSAGRYSEPSAASIWDRFGNYAEALEMVWIRYFVSFDSEEQSSLISSVKTRVARDSEGITSAIDAFRKELVDWWEAVRGDKGTQASMVAIGYGAGYLTAGILGAIFLIWIFRKLAGLSIRAWIARWFGRNDEAARIVEFYQRMQKVLTRKGLSREPHETPLEFAYALNIPEAVSITEKYNGVRFGEKGLSLEEEQEIESWLRGLEGD